MEFTTVLFYIFSILLLLSAFKVITAANPVQSALFLVLAFFNTAAIWMLLEAEFLAIVLVLVYVGAVMVLFLFVVMMLDIDLEALRQDFRRFVPLAMIIGGLIIVETSLILWHAYSATTQAIAKAATTVVPQSNAHAIGVTMFSDYIFPFEVVGLVLLVAIVAAVALTFRKRGDAKYIQANQQIATKREDSVRIVKMKSEKKEMDLASEIDSEANTQSPKGS